MEQTNGLTPKEAQRRLLLAYKDGNIGEFAEFLVCPFLNPIEQRDERNRRKIHPLLVIGIVLVLLAAGTLIFFSF
jgi:hypothetical protein